VPRGRQAGDDVVGTDEDDLGVGGIEGSGHHFGADAPGIADREGEPGPRSG